MSTPEENENVRLREATSKLVTRLFDEKLRADRAEGALTFVQGSCKLRAISDHALGKAEDRMILDILAVIERATS